MSIKYVYFFSKKTTEGKKELKELLGGKGANLAEMCTMGLPIPPGFTITTEVCHLFHTNNHKYPKGLEEQIDENLSKLEEQLGKKLGDTEDPLLVSVRSGAAVSMPGMMDTVLNLGLNDDSVQGLAKQSKDERFAFDSYRRFIQMFGDVVLGIEHEEFEHILTTTKYNKEVRNDTDLTLKDLKEIVNKYKELIRKKTHKEFPQDPKKQLTKAIDAVFYSWNNDRAIKYRQLNNITGLKGTAVNVQAMVFGNLGDDSGTGVAFSRDPSHGENVFYGEYLMNSQGEDVVAGIRTPESVSSLESQNPEIYRELIQYKDILENHFRDMQDMEFTIEKGKLYILQTRNGKRTAPAAIKIAADMVQEGLISKREAIMRITPEQLDQLLHPNVSPDAEYNVIGRGLPASPGAAVGKIVFTAEKAEELSERGERVILVRKETSPEDIGGMVAAQGILTQTGGMTSHAAVVARGMGKCCVAGCEDLVVRIDNTCEISGKIYTEADYITLNGTKGEVIEGQIKLLPPEMSEDFKKFMGWVDEEKSITVRTNADTPRDSKVARKLGAQGIGLCRTEHMFFEGNRINTVRQMILAKTTKGRRAALAKILPMQQGDFLEIFKAMDGLPVTIRLLDPPLHEFLPNTEEGMIELSKELGVDIGVLKEEAESLREFNPMLGHRGCRLAITYPEIAEMQSEAIFKAAIKAKQEGISVIPEIMIPLVSTEKEFTTLKEVIKETARQIFKKEGEEISFTIGTMIEIPRACLIADKIAAQADFFSFGTNDLTQMTFGFSRDDAGIFLREYVEKGILSHNPFHVLDTSGVGQLVSMGIQKGRGVKSDLKIGICGEHGGEPQSVEFCYLAGMNYVSCSPYRVPIARLAAAQAKIKNESS